LTPALEGGDDPISVFAKEMETAVDCVKTGKVNPLLSGELARNALLMCHREIESVRTGKAVSMRA
jgi:hypothetical protein